MNNNEQSQQNCKLGSVGGQAIIEGVMMKSKNHTAIAVRRMDNKKISVSRKGNKTIADKYTFLKWPLLRGVVNFVESMMLSFSTITEGTDMLGIDTTDESSSKFDKWLEEKCGKWLIPVVSTVSAVLGIFLAVGLFIWLPTFISNLFFGSHYTNDFSDGVLRSILEGVLKIVIFIAYIFL